MKKNKNILTRLVREDDGGVLMLVGLSFGIMVLAAGFTIDYARAQIVRERLQWAVDAAALAGAKVINEGVTKAEKEANDYFRANFPEGYMGTSGGKIALRQLPNTVNGRGRGIEYKVIGMSMKTLIVRAAGITNMKLNALAHVNTMTAFPIDVVFSLDLSGSMQVVAGKGCRFLPYGSHCYDGTSKLTEAKAAMKSLVNNLHIDDGRIRFGLVGWSTAVNTYGVLGGNRPSWGCDGGNRVSLIASESPNTHAVAQGNAGPLNMYNHCYEFSPGTVQGSGSLRPMLYLTTNKQTVMASIDAQRAEANTDGALGTYWAWNMLRNGNPGNFLHWKEPARNRAMIILTDGENTMYYNRPGESGANVVGANANQRQLDICNAARSQGINIYTIAYDMDDSPSRAAAKALLNNCASSVCFTRPNNRCYFDAKNAGDLNSAMVTIGDTMMTMRLVK